MISITTTCSKLVNVSKDRAGFISDSTSIVPVYPNAMKKRKLPKMSQYKNEKSAG